FVVAHVGLLRIRIDREAVHRARVDADAAPGDAFPLVDDDGRVVATDCLGVAHDRRLRGLDPLAIDEIAHGDTACAALEAPPGTRSARYPASSARLMGTMYSSTGRRKTRISPSSPFLTLTWQNHSLSFMSG